jgi:hypothetical protein
MNIMAPLSARSIWLGLRFTWSICDSSPAIADEVLKSIGVVVRADEDDDSLLVLGRELSLDVGAGTGTGLFESDRVIFLDLMHCRLMVVAERRRTVNDEFILVVLFL